MPLLIYMIEYAIMLLETLQTLRFLSCEKSNFLKSIV